jgi:excisionase family DNA binding protein
MSQGRPLEANDRLLLSVEEFARCAGVSRQFVRLEIARGKIRATRLGRRVLLRTNEINRYLAAASGE